MVDRLVLGCGDLCFSLARRLRDQDGRLRVVDPDQSQVKTLREMSISAETGSLTDPEELAAIGIDPGVVFVLLENDDNASGTVEAAKEAFPAAHVISLPESHNPNSQSQTDVDTVFSPGEAILDAVDSARDDPAAHRLQSLRRTLQSMDGRLVILTHNNPDPDALGAALALRSIAERFDVEAEIAYFGDITHQENRAFVNLLEVDINQLSNPAAIGGDHLALVDHSRPGVNNRLPEGMPIDIVIDHHPTPTTPTADFVDVREDVGATSTLLVEYLKGYGIQVERTVATGLLYGIRIDTREFSREATPRDFEAAAFLLPNADLEVLSKIESPSVSPQTLETIGRAIRNRRKSGAVLTSCVGEISSRDSLAQAADRLLGLTGISVTLVCGYKDDVIHLSGRTKGGGVNLGETFRVAFGDLGSAGGHDSMAGAQLPKEAFETLSLGTGEPLGKLIGRAVKIRFEQALEGTVQTR